MLFDVTRGELVGFFGEDRLMTLPGTSFPASAADTEGARFLQTVGVPTGTLWLREPDEGDGLLPLVQDVVDAEVFEDAPADAVDGPSSAGCSTPTSPSTPVPARCTPSTPTRRARGNSTGTSPPSSR